MKLKPLLIGLIAAGILSGAGYGLYATGMNRGMGMAPAQSSADDSDVLPAASAVV